MRRSPVVLSLLAAVLCGASATLWWALRDHTDLGADTRTDARGVLPALSAAVAAGSGARAETSAPDSGARTAAVRRIHGPRAIDGAPGLLCGTVVDTAWADAEGRFRMRWAAGQRADLRVAWSVPGSSGGRRVSNVENAGIASAGVLPGSKGLSLRLSSPPPKPLGN